MSWLLVGFCVLRMAIMVIQDTLGTSMIVAMTRKLRFWPGLFDGLGDFAAAYGGGVIAYSVIKWGLGSPQTLLIVFCTAVTSYFTTNEVTTLANQLLPKEAA